MYVTRIPQGALQRTIDLDGQPRTVTLTDYLGVNSPDKPLEACWRKSQRRAVYVEVANWVDRQLAAAPAAPPAPPAPAAAFAPLARAASRPSRQPGERYALAIALHMHGQQWSHRFSLPQAADFYHTALACPPPAQYVTQPQVVAADVAEALEDRLAELLEELNDEESFHLGQLGQLDKVERQDLRNYFLDQQICSCPEPYRREFPGLLLAGRRDMSFDAAVSTIQRGEPDNWGTLCEELKDLTARGVWPPAADEAHFWTSRYGC